MSMKDKVVTLEDLKAAQMLSVKPDWEQDDSTAPDYIKNRPIEKIEMETGETVNKEPLYTYDATETNIDTDNDSGVAAVQSATVSPLEGEPTHISLSVNGSFICQEEPLKTHPTYGVSYAGNIGLVSGSTNDDTGEDYLLYTTPGMSYWYAGFSLSGSQVIDSVTVTTYKLTKTPIIGLVNKINKELLYNPDWDNDDAVSPSFIKNKPFYEENTTEEVTYTLYESVLSSIEEGFSKANGGYAINFNMPIEIQNDIDQISNYEKVKVAIGDNELILNRNNPPYPYKAGFGNLSIISSQYSNNGESMVLLLVDQSQIVSVGCDNSIEIDTIKTNPIRLIFEKPVVKTISEKYLPVKKIKYNSLFDENPFVYDKPVDRQSDYGNTIVLSFNIYSSDIYNYYQSVNKTGSFIIKFIRVYDLTHSFLYHINDLNVTLRENEYTIYYSKNILEEDIDNYFTGNGYNSLSDVYISSLNDLNNFLNYKIIIVERHTNDGDTNYISAYFITNNSNLALNDPKIGIYAEVSHKLIDKYTMPVYWDTIVDKPFGVGIEPVFSGSLVLNKDNSENSAREENQISYKLDIQNENHIDFDTFSNSHGFYFSIDGLLEGNVLIEGDNNAIPTVNKAHTKATMSDYIYDTTGNDIINKFGRFWLTMEIDENNTVTIAYVDLYVDNDLYLNDSRYKDFSTVDTFTIKIYSRKNIVKKIDPVYLPEMLPEVSSEDSGKFLRVNSSGKWSVENVPNAEGSEF